MNRQSGRADEGKDVGEGEGNAEEGGEGGGNGEEDGGEVEEEEEQEGGNGSWLFFCSIITAGGTLEIESFSIHNGQCKLFSLTKSLSFKMLARIDYEFEQMEFDQIEFERMEFENLVRSFSGVFTVNLSAPVWAL